MQNCLPLDISVRRHSKHKHLKAEKMMGRSWKISKDSKQPIFPELKGKPEEKRQRSHRQTSAKALQWITKRMEIQFSDFHFLRYRKWEEIFPYHEKYHQFNLGHIPILPVLHKSIWGDLSTNYGDMKNGGAKITIKMDISGTAFSDSLARSWLFILED